MALIGLDIDGCIYPWTEAVNQAVEERYGYEGLIEHTHWDYLADRIAPQHFKWVWSPEAAPHVFGRNDLIYPSAREAVQYLCDEHDVHFVTHRNPEILTGITGDYLEQYFTGYKGVHVLANGESKYFMRWDVFVEDKPDNLWQLTKVPKLLAPVRPWNPGAKAIYFDNWNLVPGLVAA